MLDQIDPVLCMPESQEELVVCQAACARILATMRRCRTQHKHGNLDWTFEPRERHLHRGARHALTALGGELSLPDIDDQEDHLGRALARLAMAAALEPREAWSRLT
jgi:hypothetical protein